MELYGLKNCDTCKKALKALNDVTFFDVRADGLPSDVLMNAIDSFGDALINKRSKTWRNLEQSERESEIATLIKSHPTIMKRPLIQRDGALFLGWTPNVQQDLGIS